MESIERTIPTSGESRLQARFGTGRRAAAFEREQVLDHLNPDMWRFVARMEMLFVATADARGNCDCSLRTGPLGFIRVLDAKTLVYPEYRGNGVMASLGNILENPHVGLVMYDFVESTIGLHVNGRASVLTNEALLERPALPAAVAADIAVDGGRHPECWVLVEVEAAYIHCSKHVPRLVKIDKTIAWGSDDREAKGGDYFRVSARRRSLGRGQGPTDPSSGDDTGR